MTSTNMHKIVTMYSVRTEYTSWLEIMDAKESSVTMFMPPHEADAVADAWNAAHTSPPEKAMMDAMFDKLGIVPS